jgi:uncharacterized protein YozE (UPF0346 family)
MKKTVCSLITTVFLLLFTVAAFASPITGSGSSVIHEENVKLAEKKAHENALKDAVRNYFISSGKSSTPEITGEFFKFFNNYKIISKYVQDNTVFYNIVADIDELAVSNISYYIKDATNSAVFDINGNISQALKSGFTKVAEGVLTSFNFTLSSNADFIADLPKNPQQEELINSFATTSAQFLINFTANSQIIEDSCEIELLTKIFSRDKEYPLIKITTRSVETDTDACLADAFKSAVYSSTDYIRKNIVPMPAGAGTPTKYTVKAVNFSKFQDVQSFMDFLKRRAVFRDYTIKTFSLEEAVFEADTVFSKDSLIRNLQDLKEKYGYEARIDGSEVFLDFSSKSQ